MKPYPDREEFWVVLSAEFIAAMIAGSKPIPPRKPAPPMWGDRK